tara:strand:- start:12 stop:1364 length:1353 start_codon:yes stop_codon:yes gene_type:complete
MARSKSIGGAFATLSLRDLKFRKGLKSARRSLNKFGSSAVRVGTVAMAALTAGMIAGTKRTITMGAELDHLSTQTGVAVGDLMRIQQAYKDNGKAAKSAGKDINKMQRAIFEASEDPGGSMDYFAQMGLSAEKLMGMNSTEQFFTIGEAIKGIRNQTKQAALAMDVFGRSGGELLTVFKGSSLADVNASLGRMPELMQRFSAEMERADTIMGRLPNKSDQFFTGFTAGIINQILPGLEKVNDTDFTDIGENLGLEIAKALEIITSGKAWDLFELHAEQALLTIQASPALNGLAAHINTLFDGMTTPDWNWNYDDALAKYKNAGIQANIDLIDALQADIDLINSTAAASVAEKRGDNPGLVERTMDAAREAIEKALARGGIVPPESVATAIAAPAARRESTSAREISQFQRRGLSMSKNPGSVQNKVLKVQEDIRDILAAAQVAGGLKWAI